MSNMAYCRYENTLSDLRDCYDHWDEDLVSESEIRAKKRLLRLCQDIVADWGEDEP